MGVLKAYKFRIYPDEEQKKFFIETFGCVRFVYNYLLMVHKANEGSVVTPASLKKEYPFLKKTDSLALANAQIHLKRAFANHFNGRAGYPKLKRKDNAWQSYTTNNQQHTIYFEGNQLKLPKLKTLVTVNCHRCVAGNIRSATISARNNEEFYVSLLCSEEIQPLPKTQQKIEIVYCPKKLVVLSVQQELPDFNQMKLIKQLKRETKKLKVRAKSAKKHHLYLKEAKNYQKQRLRVKQLNRLRIRQKEDYINQLTMRLVREFDFLLIESSPDFPRKSTDRLFSENDWQNFLRKMQYKVRWYGKELKFLPSNLE